MAGSISRAIQYHQSGDWKKAEQIYRQVLDGEPHNADALHLLGMIAHQRGQHEQATELIQRAIAIQPGTAAFYGNLGVVLRAQGKLGDAVAAYQRALELKSDYPEALCNLGNVWKSQGKLDEAIDLYRQALQIKSNFADAHCHLGAALRNQGKLGAAIAACRRAVQIRPTYAEAHLNLGNALRDQGALDEAVAALKTARQLAPRDADVHNNLGNALQDHGDLEAAVAAYRQAIELRPSFAEAHNNLGAALRNQGKPHEGAASYRRALQIDPDFADARWNHALYLLSNAEFDRGWEEYEWRWKIGRFSPRQFAQPIWDGRSLEGKTILVHAEQGLGDTIQFARYLKLVKQRGGTVYFECQRPLAQLLQNVAGLDQLVVQGDELPSFDRHIPLLSLPRVFQTSLDTIPADIPYLAADPELVEFWKCKMGTHSGLKVGICWQGSPTWNRDRFRSFSLKHFAALAELPAVHLVSLQKGYGVEQIEQFKRLVPLTDFGPQLDERSGPFVDTAAVISNLDLVVACDTAIAHLAGALGTQVWLAEEFVGEWRWLRDRADSPWYPTMRLFRQTSPGDWAGVFERIVQTLRNQLLSARQPGP